MSHVHYSLCHPAAVRARHAKRRIGRALHFHRRMMAGGIDRLAARLSRKMQAFDLHGKTTEEEPAGRHLVDERVQPFGEQQRIIGRFALDR
jgi:hypothetical protein